MRDVEKEGDLGDIIATIYEAAFNPAQWQQVLQMVGQRIDARASAVYLHDFRSAGGQVPSFDASFAYIDGIEASALRDYALHYGSQNPWARNEDALQPGRAVTSSMLYPDRLLLKTEFYSDWLRKVDLFYSLGGVVDRQQDLALKFSFMRPAGRGAYAREELSLWQRLIPHVRRATSMHMRLSQLEQRAAKSEQALGSLVGGVIVLGANLRVVSINEDAKALLKPERGLNVSRAGHLLATPISTNTILQQALRAACLPSVHGQNLPIVPPTQGCDGGLTVTVVTLPRAPGAQHTWHEVAVIIADARPRLETLVAALQPVYGLTPSEAELVAGLVDGHTLAKVAERRNVSIHTVRTQLKSATAKVGAKRQADLVRTVLTGPAMRALRRPT